MFLTALRPGPVDVWVEAKLAVFDFLLRPAVLGCPGWQIKQLQSAVAGKMKIFCTDFVTTLR